MDEKTFEQLAADEVSTVYVDRFEDSVRVLILRGPASLRAYLGIPKDHPLASLGYDDVPVECHGGLTFSGEGGGEKCESWPEGYHWFGWDYAHCGDFCFYDLKYPGEHKSKDKKWIVKDVEGEMWMAVYSLKKLMKIAEHAATRQWRAVDKAEVL